MDFNRELYRLGRDIENLDNQSDSDSVASFPMDDNMFLHPNNREEIEDEIRRIQEAINRDWQNADRYEMEANMRRMEELENEISRIMEQDDQQPEDKMEIDKDVMME